MTKAVSNICNNLKWNKHRNPQKWVFQVILVVCAQGHDAVFQILFCLWSQWSLTQIQLSRQIQAAPLLLAAACSNWLSPSRAGWVYAQHTPHFTFTHQISGTCCHWALTEEGEEWRRAHCDVWNWWFLLSRHHKMMTDDDDLVRNLWSGCPRSINV